MVAEENIEQALICCCSIFSTDFPAITHQRVVIRHFRLQIRDQRVKMHRVAKRHWPRSSYRKVIGNKPVENSEQQQISACSIFSSAKIKVLPIPMFEAS